MKPQTRYAYEKRIADLDREVIRLRPYRELAIEIFDAMIANHKQGKGTNEQWLIEKYRKIFR